jgi:hypothetical protein
LLLHLHNLSMTWWFKFQQLLKQSGFTFVVLWYAFRNVCCIADRIKRLNKMSCYTFIKHFSKIRLSCTRTHTNVVPSLCMLASGYK